jgi:hypothetical protein
MYDASDFKSILGTGGFAIVFGYLMKFSAVQLNGRGSKILVVTQVVYGYQCDFQTLRVSDPEKGPFLRVSLRHLVLSPMIVYTSSSFEPSDFLKNICARPIFSKSSEFSVGGMRATHFRSSQLFF